MLQVASVPPCSIFSALVSCCFAANLSCLVQSKHFTSVVPMKNSFARLFLIVAVFVSALSAHASGPLLMQKPTLSKTHIAFAYAGDLWLVSREGGEARLLTSGTGTKSDPVFSPDGSMIAFTGDYDGNVDVYVMPSSGGVPKRLTYHPAWTRWWAGRLTAKPFCSVQLATATRASTVCLRLA